MSGRKNILLLAGLTFSVSLMASSLMAVAVSRSWSRITFELLNSVCGRILEQEPEGETAIAAALKQTAGEKGVPLEHPQVLRAWGYDVGDFVSLPVSRWALSGAVGFIGGILLFAFTFGCRSRREARRVKELTRYLEQVNLGRAGVMGTFGDDVFSGLEDEIYKTVTFLNQTRDQAVETKNGFAENLSNIAHQIKTPITAISLTLQAMERQYGRKCVEPIRKQLLRLTRLEEALLVLSRLDAGVLVLGKEKVDVFTLLVLAADNLEELFRESGTSIDIPERGEITIIADLEWTMEAVMNLMKNCMEHNRGGKVHCDYEQNPLYTKIQIWDEGHGFSGEDLPHVFQRFYRGKNGGGDGIGIGLALAKEMIERQNGIIRARNMQGGGACFEVRFYGQNGGKGTMEWKF